MKHTIQCPAERAIYFLGGKWKIRIVFLLYQNKKNRFGEINSLTKTPSSDVKEGSFNGYESNETTHFSIVDK